MSLKVFFSIFSSGGRFVQRSKTFLAHLVESYQRNISMKLFEIGPSEWNDFIYFGREPTRHHSCKV